MKRVFLSGLIIAINLCSLTIMAQEKSIYGKYVLSFSGGVQHSFNSFGNDVIADQLVSYQDPHSFVDLFSFTYYLNKNIGVGIKIRSNYGKTDYDRAEKFNADFEKRWGTDYFIRREFSTNSPFYGDYGTYLFGVEYRFFISKWEITPGLYAGSTEVNFDSYTVDLKRKGSHEIVSYYARSENQRQELERDQGFLTFSPSIRFAYRMNSFTLIHTTVQFTTLKAEFRLIETQEYQIEERIVRTENKYSERLNTLGIGFGLVFELGKLKRMLLPNI